MTVNCPYCGTTQIRLARTVKVLQVKPIEAVMSEVSVSIFECQTCKATFNQDIPTPTNRPKAEPTWTDLKEKLVEIRLGLKQNLANLKRNLDLLQTERSSVLFEIEALRKDSESKAIGLEEDVNRLREEIQDLRTVLGLEETVD